MAFNKPNVNTPWAATGEIVSPAPAKVAQGWIEEIPDFEFENWVQNRQDQFNAHVNQFGVPVWDSTTIYESGKSYVQGSDGVVYRALTSNTNKNPTTSSSNWVQAFDPVGTSFTKAESNSAFAKRASNLSDLTSAPAARTNLNVYSKTETDNKYESVVNLVGMVTPFGGTSAPTGWLKCNGQAVNRSAYIELFNQIGTTYGNGNGTTTFNLPDLRGEFIRGFDDGRGVDSGRAIGTSQTDALGSHSHTGDAVSAGNHTHTGSSSAAGSHTHSGTTSTAGAHTHTDRGSFAGDLQEQGAQGQYQFWIGTHQTESSGSHAHSLPINSTGSHNHTMSLNDSGVHTHTLSINSTGGAETRPRNVAMLYCIKF